MDLRDTKANLVDSNFRVFSEKYRLEIILVTAPTRLLPDGNLKKDYFSDALLICSE